MLCSKGSPAHFLGEIPTSEPNPLGVSLEISPVKVSEAYSQESEGQFPAPHS